MDHGTAQQENDRYAPDGSHLKTNRIYWEQLERAWKALSKAAYQDNIDCQRATTRLRPVPLAV